MTRPPAFGGKPSTNCIPGQAEPMASFFSAHAGTAWLWSWRRVCGFLPCAPGCGWSPCCNSQYTGSDVPAGWAVGAVAPGFCGEFGKSRRKPSNEYGQPPPGVGQKKGTLCRSLFTGEGRQSGLAHLPSFYSRDVVTHSGAERIKKALKHGVSPINC